MRRNGFTLIELAVVMAVIAIAAAITVPAIFELISPKSRLKANVNNLYSDIIFAQNEAIRQGAYNLIYDQGGGGTLRQRKVFFVFEPPANPTNGYSIWRWEDIDGDNVVEAGEFDPEMAGGADEPVKDEELDIPDRLYYGYVTNGDNPVNKSACGNSGSAPANPVTFKKGNLPPCGNNQCRYIEFDSNGFTDKSGTVYVTDGEYSYAISGNKAGIFNICVWMKDASSGQWQWMPMH